MMAKRAMIIPIILLFTYLSYGVTIEYTYFYPNRWSKSSAMNKWGENWQWPIKTFPQWWYDEEQRFGTAYGLIYWPGEEVVVSIKNGNGAVDRLSCYNVITSDSLPCVKTGADGWKIVTVGNKSAPYLEVYRVRAYTGATEVASRGLIVALPYSGMKGSGDPAGPTAAGFTFNEWRNGGDPYDYMAYMFGNFNNQVYPFRNKPWSRVDVYGLCEFYDPSLRKADSSGTSDAYSDRMLEWNSYWIFYGEGSSYWNAEWQWGPFGAMAVEQNPNTDMCYSNVKKNVAAFPNGLLFWQVQQYGLQKACEIQYENGSAPLTIGASDGWAENSMFDIYGYGATLGRAYEMGSIPLFYKHCQYYNRPLTWATTSATIGAFAEAQLADYNNGNKANNYVARFIQGDLNAFGTNLWNIASRDAYTAVTGNVTTSYGRNFSALDNSFLSGIQKDHRTVNGFMYSKCLTKAETGGDYTHFWTGGSNNYFRGTRSYRGYGLRGAITCALYPECHYGGGYSHGSLGAGAIMPGCRDWDKALTATTYPGNSYLPYHDFMDDGTSYRRFDMFERFPMFYKPDGTLAGSEIAFVFGSNSSYEASENGLWNTQAVLGMQLMELADRLRPIGGVMIFDSNNEADRALQKEFKTENDFSDYVAALTDSLGIATYANPDAAQAIPAHIPRIYAPRKDGDAQVYLIADVAGTRIKVPYSGATDQTPSSVNFKSFVNQIKAAMPGGWPISTTGGFVASAWESSKGVFVYIENPMPATGQIHTARSGSVTVAVRGLTTIPAVIDMCGYDPDPSRLPDNQVHVNGERVTIDLNWQKGDARLFYINFTPVVGIQHPAHGLKSVDPIVFALTRGSLMVRMNGLREQVVQVYSIDGRLVTHMRGRGPQNYCVPLDRLGQGVFYVRAVSDGWERGRTITNVR